jgi:hypothetical protein
MTQQTKEAVQQWLDEAAAAMSGRAKLRRDALLELETTIYERLEDLEREGEATIDDIVAAMGDPIQVGSSIMPAEPLVPGHRTRHFYLHTGIVFAVHFLLLVAATLAQSDFSVPPLRIAPIENPTHVLTLLGTALHTLLFDAGLVLCGYVAFGKLGRIISVPRKALAVRPRARHCLESALFLGLVLVLFNFFRESLLAIYLPTDEGARQVSLVGPGIVDNLALFNLWLGCALVRDLCYARLGERKTTLWIDLVASAAGLFCLLRIVASRQLVDLSNATEELGTAADGIGGLLNTVFVLLALAAAALVAVRAVQRAFRLALLRS